MIRLAFVAVVATFAADAAVLFSADGDIKLRNRQSRELRFCGVDPAKGRVVVDFHNRIDYPKAGGWCPCWQIFVNGTLLSSAATRSETRLLNRPYHLNNRWHGKYPADNHSDKWYALYLPDCKEAARHFSPPTQEATHTVLDISDLVQVGETNTVTLRAGGVPGSIYSVNNYTNHKPQVVFSDVRIYSEETPTRLRAAARKAARATFAPPPETRFEIDRDDAGFNVSVNGETVAVKSMFSVPGGGAEEMGGRDRLETPFYSVVRKVVREHDRIDVFDTFVSKTNALIGVKVRYEIPQKGFDPVYVAGDPSPSAEEFEGGRNPSVLGVCAEKGFSVALLAQDDVFRVQNVQYCKDGAFGLRTDGLALKPGEPPKACFCLCEGDEVEAVYAYCNLHSLWKK